VAALGGTLAFLPACAIAQEFTLEEATIPALQAAFAAGETTCVDVVQTYLDRIEAYDHQGPSLNAILYVNPAALEVAAAMDAAYAADPASAGPLFCVPVILKDNYDTYDMPTTGGVAGMAENIPPDDAFTVARLREAGALILAKANLTELAHGGTTISSLGGQTLNPYDLTRTPGGSSGGTGAAIAANFGMIGTGSDTGQSIRSPASANGLVGIRNTRGLVSRDGVIPNTITRDAVGPITRSVEDAAIMLQAMAGFDPADPITAASIGNIPTYTDFLDPDALDGARIGLLLNLVGPDDEAHAEVNRVTREAMAIMEGLGAEVIEFSIPNFSTGGMGGGNEQAVAYRAYFEALGDDVPVNTLEALVAVEHSDFVHDTLVEAMEAPLDTLETDLEYQAGFYKRDLFQQSILLAMAENDLDAILYPHQRVLVAPISPEQSQPERNGALSNSSGFPAVTFAGGFSAPDGNAPLGVPVGIEFLGRPWSEGELIGYAYAFEQAAKIRVPPASTPWLDTLVTGLAP
jgi:Asp-tRNA(Asn)/Glu-tRNA(Gln) amidotransferase A subunit family amidase